jgi:hypothetical protein
LFGFLERAWRLTKDQAILELIPARYELALQLSLTREQYSKVLNQFMQETALSSGKARK